MVSKNDVLPNFFYFFLCLLLTSCYSTVQSNHLKLESVSEAYFNSGKKLILKPDIESTDNLSGILFTSNKEDSDKLNLIYLEGNLYDENFTLKNDTASISGSFLKNEEIQIVVSEKKETLKKQKSFSRGVFKISQGRFKQTVQPFRNYMDKNEIFEGKYELLYQEEKNGSTYLYLYYEHPSLGYSRPRGNCGLGIESYLCWLKVDESIEEVKQSTHQLRSCYSYKNPIIENTSGFDIDSLKEEINKSPTINITVESNEGKKVLRVNLKNIEKGIEVIDTHR